MPYRRLLLVLLLCAQALFAQIPDADKGEAVKEFQKQFKKFKEESQQIEAVMTLKGNGCKAAVDELLKLLKHSSAGIQQAALAVLETYQDPAVFQSFIDNLPTMKDADTQAVLAKVLGRAKVKTAVPALQKIVTPKAPPPLKFEVLRALQSIGDPGAAGTVETLLADPDGSVRMAAADCAGALKLKPLGPKLVPLINDPEWQVQTAAVTASGVLRPQEAVQPLIDLMKKAGRLRIECADALFRITTFDFGLDPERWQQQWDRLMSVPGYKVPTDEELAKKAESRKKTDAFYGKRGSNPTFAGIQTTSTRVLFIIDVSGSMDDLVVEREKFPGYTDFKKFTVVKTQLLAAIDSLTDNTYFGIVAFASDLHPWKSGLVQANIVNREAAKGWVQHLAPIAGVDQQDLAAAGLSGSANLSAGKTNTLKALLYAFGIDPENPPKGAITGVDKGAMKNKLDTVYFLSDGRPSVGKMVDTNEILKEVRRYNEIYRIVIHTIAIGEFQKEFLEDLAKNNGGTFVDMGR